MVVAVHGSRTRRLAQVAVLSAVAAALALFSVPVVPFAPFYRLELSGSIVLISGFSLGPTAGVVVALAKTLVKLLIRGSDSAGIGAFANCIFNIALMVPAALVYKKRRTIRGAINGMALGLALLLVVSLALNFLLLLPLAANLFGTAFLQRNGLVPALFAALVFNLAKGAMSCLLALFLYKKTQRILEFFSR